MTYRLVNIYIQENPVSNNTEYFCWYYSNNGSLIKARITQATFENLKKELKMPDEISIKQHGAKK